MHDACVYVGGAPTSIRKRSQLISGHAGSVFVRSKLQLMESGSEFCDSFAAEVETLLLIKNRKNRRPDPNCVTPVSGSVSGDASQSRLI